MNCQTEGMIGSYVVRTCTQQNVPGISSNIAIAMVTVERYRMNKQVAYTVVNNTKETS